MTSARGAVLREGGRPRPYAASRPLGVEELTLDAPAPREVLVRIDAAGVCHSDLSVVDGTRPRPLPMLLGHEAAGTVVDAGAGAVGVSAGDRVVLVFVPACGLCSRCGSGKPALCPQAARASQQGHLLGGGTRVADAYGPVNHHLGVSAFAEMAVVARESLVPIPGGVPAEIAALFGCAALTGFGAVVNTAEVRAGESVAVFGLGGVGLSAVMAAVAVAAVPVVGVDPDPGKRQVAERLGAVSLHPEDIQARGKSSGDTFDCTIEAAGRPDAMSSAIAATARGGRVVMVGLPDPSASVALNPTSVVSNEIQILGCYMGSSVPARDVPRMITLWKARRFPVENLLGDVIGLDDLNTALDRLASGTVVRQIVNPRQ